MFSPEDHNLPSTWKTTTVMEVTVRTSQRDPGKQPDKTFRYIDVSSVDNILFKIRSVARLKGAEAPSRARKDVRGDDVLFATVRPTLKRVSLVPKELDGEIASTGYCVLRSNPERIDPAFLYSCVLSDWFIDAMRKLERGASYPAVRDSDVFSAQIPLPPLGEQRTIVGVLAVAQQAIEHQDRLLQITAELKRTLLHQLLVEGLRGESRKQTDIGPLPDSWKVTELGKVVNLFGGYAFKSEEGVVESCTQLVRMGNLYQNKLDLTRNPIFYPDEFSQKYPRFVLKPGDLIMSLTGTTGKEDYGFTVELNSSSKTLLLNQRVARIDLLSNDLVKDFLFYFLLSRKFLDHLYPTAKGMKQANLSTHAMKRLNVPVPSIDEQKEIASYLRTVDQKSHIHQKRIDLLRDLYRTLLQRLLTADLRVHDLELSQLEAAAAE